MPGGAIGRGLGGRLGGSWGGSIDDSIRKLNDELDRINGLKARAEELRKGGLARKASMDVEINSVREELARVNAEIEHVETELSLLRGGGSVERCPLCGRPLDRELAQELVVSREVRLRELMRRREELMSRLSRLSGEAVELDRLENELRSIEGELSKEVVVKASLEDLRRRRDSLLEELSRLDGYDEETLRRELKEVEDELSRLNRELEELG
ncbi:hypothetical protein [Vulcanisaeta distributa]|uniref:hypothetical protein n=1 Tax=Vulcanisaeta distributa TaxID=164451 RepID=UPI0006D26C5D|nr:hypothetical protein [Vulcanisaeta distributa]